MAKKLVGFSYEIAMVDEPTRGAVIDEYSQVETRRVKKAILKLEGNSSFKVVGDEVVTLKPLSYGRYKDDKGRCKGQNKGTHQQQQQHNKDNKGKRESAYNKNNSDPPFEKEIKEIIFPVQTQKDPCNPCTVAEDSELDPCTDPCTTLADPCAVAIDNELDPCSEEEEAKHGEFLHGVDIERGFDTDFTPDEEDGLNKTYARMVRGKMVINSYSIADMLRAGDYPPVNPTRCGVWLKRLEGASA